MTATGCVAEPVAATGASQGTAAAAAALGVVSTDLTDPIVIDAGPFWLVARLPSSDAVDRLRPDLAAITALSDDDPTLTGITVYGHDDGERKEPFLLFLAVLPPFDECLAVECPGQAAVPVFVFRCRSPILTENSC